jgi:uncharacterized protein (DUF1684 family)
MSSSDTPDEAASAAEVRMPPWLDLYDYRERVACSYRERDVALRAGEDPETVWLAWRSARDALFATHPQSALDGAARREFRGLRYFPYDPALRIEAQLTPTADEATDALPGSPAMEQTSHGMLFRRAARLTFAIAGQPAALLAYWIDVYGGGLFLPFRDGTSGGETYGGGRYLFDTVKGSAFLRLDHATGSGYSGGRVLLDFNYAYNPSCAYDARWACPLAPTENRLQQPVRAGEQAFHE